MIELLNIILLLIIVLLATLKANRCDADTPWYDKAAFWMVGVGAFSALAWREPTTIAELILNCGFAMIIIVVAYPELRRFFCDRRAKSRVLENKAE
jgi:hypothetical protein